MSKRPFEEIVEHHGPTVLRVTRAVLGPDEADDAWSETFLAALRAYPALDEAANVEAWLVTIAHRKAIDVARARAREGARRSDGARVHERPWDGAPSPADGRPAAEHLAVQAGPEPADAALWACLRALPQKQRQTVAYHYLADLPYADVAAIVGGTAEAARRAAADGIRTLRRIYAPAAERTKG